MAARAVANHGLGGLTLVDPPGFDPERARWMAPGAHDVIDGAEIVGTVAQAVADAVRVVGTTARTRRWDWPVQGPEALAAEIRDDPQPTAILFGPEDAGLSNEDLALCHTLVRLPTERHRSLNLAQAVTVLGSWLLAAHYEAEPPPPAQEPALAPARLQALVVEEALEVLEAGNYLRGRNPSQVRSTLLRLLARARTDGRELEMLRGMLKAVRWAVRR